MTLEMEGLDYSDPDTIDLGMDHAIKLMYTDETQETVASVVLLHRDLGDPDSICQGFAEVGDGEWRILEREPLTMTPSFVCNDCGDHGLVRNGAWVEANYTPSSHSEPIEWLLAAISSFTETIEEARSLYITPNRKLQYYSPRELVILNRSQQLIDWLQEQEKKYNDSLGDIDADLDSETEQDTSTQNQHYTAVSTHRSA